MNLNNIIAVFQFNLKLSLASSITIAVSILMYPLIFQSSINGLPSQIVIVILGLFIFMQVMVTTVMYVPIQETMNRETKMIKRLVASPVSKIDYLLGGVMSQYINGIIAVIVMIVLSGVSAKQAGYGILIYTLLFIPAYLFGFIISLFVNDPQSAKAIGLLFFLLIVFVLNTGGNGFISNITYILPIDQVQNIAEHLFMKTDVNIMSDLMIILGYILVYGVVVINRFRWE